MFLTEKDYGTFDEDGIPTHLKNGNPVKDKARAGFEKRWKKQNDLHQKWFGKDQEKIEEK